MLAKQLKNKKGQSLVEFALVLPLILLILMGIVEFGLMFNSYLTINNASREGARLASVGGTDVEVETRVETVSTTLNLANIDVTVNPAQGFRDRGDPCTVTVDYTYDLITPIISNILGNSIVLSSETTMRVE